MLLNINVHSFTPIVTDGMAMVCGLSAQKEEEEHAGLGVESIWGAVDIVSRLLVP